MPQTQAWQKKGLIFAPSGKLSWARKNASFPTVEILPNHYRVYFTSLDDKNIGRIGFVDLDRSNPMKVISECHEPLVDVGAKGAFDDHGVNAFSICKVENKKYLYYQGWKMDSEVPYYIFSNLAVSAGSKINFKKISEQPILGATEEEFLIRGAPFVLFDEGKFKIWYSSSSKWVVENEKWTYRISIKYAESSDGINWPKQSREVMTYSGQNDFAVGRPCVVKDTNKYLMWYSIRSLTQPYRLGYATSSDGIVWDRQDHLVNLLRSSSGWDSEMVCYPFVFKDGGQWHMFYNGNGHGASGFGYATCPNVT